MFVFSSVVDVRDQLSSAENRCNLLEKQLEYMRQHFTAAEKDRTDAVRRAAELQQYRSVRLIIKPWFYLCRNRLNGCSQHKGQMRTDELRYVKNNCNSS